MADQLPCKLCGHYAVACGDELKSWGERARQAEEKLEEWYRVEAALYAALTSRFGADAMSEAITEVTADLTAHNPLLPPSTSTEGTT